MTDESRRNDHPTEGAPRLPESSHRGFLGSAALVLAVLGATSLLRAAEAALDGDERTAGDRPPATS